MLGRIEMILHDYRVFKLYCPFECPYGVYEVQWRD